jgi:DHA2 family multidrug resistance protein
VGVLAIAVIGIILPGPKATPTERLPQQEGFDFVGFVLVATFLSALELALDRGLEDDWLGSHFIVGVIVVCVLAFV